MNIKDVKDIKALAQIMNDSGLTEIEVEFGDSKVKLVKSCAVQNQQVVYAAAPIIESVPQIKVESVPDKKENKNKDVMYDYNDLADIKSPMVGVFYGSPSPDAQPFVKVGSKVKKGDVLCIIEAMKLMNEIQAEQDGEIVDVCVKNGQVVEFRQTIFKIF